MRPSKWIVAVGILVLLLAAIALWSTRSRSELAVEPVTNTQAATIPASESTSALAKLEEAPVENDRAPAPTAETSNTEARIHVRGRVVDEAHAPVPDARVSLYSVGQNWSSAWTPRTDEPDGHKRAFAQHTGADGTFAFDVRPTTSDWISLDVDAGPYFSWSMRMFGKAGGRNLRPLALGDNDVGDLVVEAMGAVSGELRAKDGGLPITNGGVSLDNAESGGRMVNAQVDASGRFVLGHAPEGTFTVSVDADGFLSAKRAGIEVKKRATTAGLVFELERAPTISGRVVDETGAPIEDMPVRGWPEKGGQDTTARSQADGSFTLFLRQNEPYRLAVDQGGEFEAWDILTNRTTFEPGMSDVLIQLQRRLRVTFVVVDDKSGAPIERFALGTQDKPSPASSSFGLPRIRLIDHPKGEVTQPTDMAHQFVCVIAEHYAPLQVEIALDPGSSDRQTLRMKSGAAIVGRVLAADGSPIQVALRIQRGLLTPDSNDPHPNRMHDEQVSSSRGPSYDLSTWLGRSRTIDGASDGSFRVDELAPGTYEMEIKAAGHAPRYFPNFRLNEDTLLDLGTIGLEAPSYLRGHVVLAGGASPIGLRLTVDSVYADAQTISAADGAFDFGALTPGAHSVTIEEHAPVLMGQEKRTLTLAPGEMKELVIDLSSAAPCTVTIHVMRDGTPVSDARVEARTSTGVNGWQMDWHGLTNTEGNVTARVRPDPTLVFAVVGENGPTLATSEGFVPFPGGAQEITLAIAAGEVVLVLPEAYGIPDLGRVSIKLAQLGSSAGGLAFLNLRTPKMAAFHGASPWTGARSSLGLVATGDYIATVTAQRYVPDAAGGRPREELLFGPVDVKLSVRANATNEIVVTP
jgi:protocatechuate 3,4-dioxygenase beta subunit